MASLDAVRERARRGKPESSEEAVKQLLTDDRIRRLETKLGEDREARVKLEALVTLQQQTIEYLRQKLENQEDERPVDATQTGRTAAAHSAHRMLQLEDQIHSVQEQNTQLTRRVKHLEKQHAVVELSTRIGTIEAKMLGAEHLAEAVHGHFHRHSTPLLEHITDLVDDLHSRVDGLEDALPRDEGLADGGLAALVRREYQQLVAAMPTPSAVVAAPPPRSSFIVAAPPTAAELAAYTTAPRPGPRPGPGPEPEPEPEPAAAAAAAPGLPEAVPDAAGLPSVDSGSSGGFALGGNAAKWGAAETTPEDEMMTPRTEDRWIKAEAERRLAAEVGGDAQQQQPAAPQSQPLPPPLASAAKPSSSGSSSPGPPPLPSRDGRRGLRAAGAGPAAGKAPNLLGGAGGGLSLSGWGGGRSNGSLGSEEAAGDMTPRTEDRWIKSEAARLLQMEQSGAGGGTN